MRTITIDGIEVTLVKGPGNSWVTPDTDIELIKLRQRAREVEECRLSLQARDFFERSTRHFNIADDPGSEYRCDWRSGR